MGPLGSAVWGQRGCESHPQEPLPARNLLCALDFSRFSTACLHSFRKLLLSDKQRASMRHEIWSALLRCSLLPTVCSLKSCCPPKLFPCRSYELSRNIFKTRVFKGVSGEDTRPERRNIALSMLRSPSNSATHANAFRFNTDELSRKLHKTRPFKSIRCHSYALLRYKSFACHSYGKHRGRGCRFPFRELPKSSRPGGWLHQSMRLR
jgi:hypothetical protein